MSNLHKPHLAFQPKEEVSHRIWQFEWTRQVAVQPLKTSIFCLPRRSFIYQTNRLKTCDLAGQGGILNYKNFFEI